MALFKGRKADISFPEISQAAQILELAQRTADEAIADAQRKAEEIIAQAHEEAERIITDANGHGT